MSHLPLEQEAGTERHAARWLPLVLWALAMGLVSSSLLGPLGLGVMQYRTSPTTLNQLLGSDAALLLIGAPTVLIAAALVRRGHPAAPFLTVGISVYVLYTYTQVIVGQEYLRLPGNVERFFPLLLAVFILAEAAMALAWRTLPPAPPLSQGVRRVSGSVLIAVAVFLVFGLHLRSVIFAWIDPARLVEYASSPTPFWLVKLMDLGIVVPVALATGIGLLRAAAWAQRAAYVVMTGYTCLAMSVASMGLLMYVNGDPDASLPLTAGFVGFAFVLAVLTLRLYRPLFVAPVDGGREIAAASGRNEVDSALDQVDDEQDPTGRGGHRVGHPETRVRTRR